MIGSLSQLPGEVRVDSCYDLDLVILWVLAQAGAILLLYPPLLLIRLVRHIGSFG